MPLPTTGRFIANLVTQRDWNKAVALFRQLDPDVVAAHFLDLPFDNQTVLFQRLPVDLAAKLIEVLPYYHAYVLLHTRPRQDVAAIVNGMRPTERLRFFDGGSRMLTRADCSSARSTPRADL